MEQLPNGDMAFYRSIRKEFYVMFPLFVVPILALLFVAAVFYHTVDLFLVLVVLVAFGLVFVASYLMACHMEWPPYITLHADSLELYNRYGPIFISLSGIIGFTTTKGSIINVHALVLITKDFKKEYTRCFLGLLDTQERDLFINALQARGLTYFPPDSPALKTGNYKK